MRPFATDPSAVSSVPFPRPIRVRWSAEARLWLPGFRGKQEAVINHVTEGGDALVLFPTGAGKVALLPDPGALPAGCGHCRFAADRADARPGGGLEGTRHSGGGAEFRLTREEAFAVRDSLRAGALDMLYVTPERIVTDGFAELLQGVRIALFAIDEAHCVAVGS